MRPCLPLLSCAAGLLAAGVLACAAPAGAVAPPNVLTPMTVDAIGGAARPVLAADGTAHVAYLNVNESFEITLRVAERTPSSTDFTTVYTSVTGAVFENPAAAVAPNGDVTIVWATMSGGHQVLTSVTSNHATGEWTMDPDPVSTSTANVQEPDLITDAHGNMTATWIDNGHIDAARRSAQTGEWSAPQTLTGDRSGGHPDIAVDGDDNVTVFWSWSDGPGGATSTYSADAASWGAALDVPSTGGVDWPHVISDVDGNLTVTWFHGVSESEVEVWTAFRPANAGDWSGSVPTRLSAEGAYAVIPEIVVDREGNRTAIWTENVGGHYVSRYRTSEAGGDEWAPEQPVPTEGADNAGGFSIVAPDGDVTLFYKHLTDDGIAAAMIKRDRQTGTWSAPVTVPGSHMILELFPFPTSDAQGNILLAWDESAGGPLRSAHAVFIDGGAPSVSGTSVPASGTAGVAVDVATTPYDLLSGLGDTTWDFGDGGSAVGTSASHTYSAAGTYTVTVTTSDALGNRATRTAGEITIAPAPVEEDEPEVLAPKPKLDPLPATLKGRVITILARVTLRSGKRCAGKATATTTFGTTTYRTTVTLSTVTFPESGRVCAAAGKIRLKKTPSTRTKLRVTVSSKSIKSRLLTTKRV